jgi:hypothetical protein
MAKAALNVRNGGFVFGATRKVYQVSCPKIPTSRRCDHVQPGRKHVKDAGHSGGGDFMTQKELIAALHPGSITT